MKIKTSVSFVLLVLVILISISIDDLIAEDSITLKTTIQIENKSEADNIPKEIQWSCLGPENGKPFTDPFAKLTSDQLSQVSFVVRIQRLIADEKIKADGVDSKEITTIARNLKQEGVDIDWLMAQRKRVQKIRDLQVESLSKSIAKSLGDKKVTLTGYVIPIKVRQKKMTEFFLLPTSAACSNETAPPRLQVVFVSTKQGVELPPKKGIPVRVTGTVKAQSTAKLIRIGIRITTFQSAYTMLSPEIEIYTEHRQVSNSPD